MKRPIPQLRMTSCFTALLVARNLSRCWLCQRKEFFPIRHLLLVFAFQTLRGPHSVWTSVATKEMPMSWKTPRVIEVAVGMEINCYACADI